MEKIMKIEGMTCGHCKKSVEEALRGLDFLEEVEVDLDKGQARVKGENLDEATLRSTIEDLGFDLVDII